MVRSAHERPEKYHIRPTSKTGLNSFTQGSSRLARMTITEPMRAGMPMSSTACTSCAPYQSHRNSPGVGPYMPNIV